MIRVYRWLCVWFMSGGILRKKYRQLADVMFTIMLMAIIFSIYEMVFEPYLPIGKYMSSMAWLSVLIFLVFYYLIRCWVYRFDHNVRLDHEYFESISSSERLIFQIKSTAYVFGVFLFSYVSKSISEEGGLISILVN